MKPSKLSHLSSKEEQLLHRRLYAYIKAVSACGSSPTQKQWKQTVKTGRRLNRAFLLIIGNHELTATEQASPATETEEPERFQVWVKAPGSGAYLQASPTDWGEALRFANWPAGGASWIVSSKRPTVTVWTSWPDDSTAHIDGPHRPLKQQD